MSMVTPNDIKAMQESIREVIKLWGTSVILLRELPVEEQPNYDELLHEYNGDIAYEEFVVPAERYDQLADYDVENKEKQRSYGQINDSLQLYHIPDDIEIVPNENMFVVDGHGDIYYIEKVAKRIGQYIIHCKTPKEELPISLDSLSNDYNDLGWL